MYQNWDKAADLVSYVLMFLVGRRWKIGKTITFLFVMRAVGQALFFITGDDAVFFFLPNFLEPLFMTYALLLLLDKKKAYKRYKKHIRPIWIAIIAYKMWNEYSIHIARRDLSTLYFGFNN